MTASLRRAGLVALLALAVLPTGGCVVSLFSDVRSDDDVTSLEERMDAIERALPSR